jgi:hypothetical protein
MPGRPSLDRGSLVSAVVVTDQVNATNQARRRADWREVQANRGMAALLMPSRLFQRIAFRQITDLGSTTVSVGSAAADDVATRMANTFMVSKHAAMIRLETLEVCTLASGDWHTNTMGLSHLQMHFHATKRAHEDTLHAAARYGLILPARSGSMAGSKWGANMRAERSWTAFNGSERTGADLRKSHFRRSAHDVVLGSHLRGHGDNSAPSSVDTSNPLRSPAAPINRRPNQVPFLG